MRNISSIAVVLWLFSVGAQAGAAFADGAQEKARLVSEWAAAKPRLETRVKVDLPAAFARRDQESPYYQSIIRFPDRLLSARMADHRDRRTAFWAAMDQLKETNPRVRESYVGLERLGVCVKRLMALSDPAPIDGAGKLTISDAAREIAGFPGVDAILRGSMAEAERKAFGDEATAQKVEALGSKAELDAYLQAGAQERYFSAYRQRVDSFPIDAALRGYMEEDHQYRALASLFKGNYLLYWEAEPRSISREMEDWRATARVHLSQWSDDEAVRHIVADIEDLGRRLDQTLARMYSLPAG